MQIKKFEMNLDGNTIDTNDEKTSKGLVKFLRNKAILDFLDELPIEVSAAMSW